MAMACISLNKQTPVPMKAGDSNYRPYPQPLASYEDVLASHDLFMATLEKLHTAMDTRFMIPIIGGKELDLHRLFVVVTARGGIDKIISERRWKEVTATFNFPSTATNASFVLRKYYFSLIYHYEQIYYLKAQGWIQTSSELSHSPSIAIHPEQIPEVQASVAPTSAALIPTGKDLSKNSPLTVVGVIDGKFETGYLVTVVVGSKKLKGVIYHTQHNPVSELPQQLHVVANNGNTVCRRRRRKKSEIKKRDPAHPKPNRSGYNFFFAEQHARLKPLHPGRDREISRMIGELWNKLQGLEKSVYQEKAIEDKERYRVEMEGYRERLRTGQITSNALTEPQQQETNEVDSESQMMDGESVSGIHDSEDDDEIREESSLGRVVGECSNAAGIDVLAEEAVFELHNRQEGAMLDQVHKKKTADDLAQLQ